MNVFDNLLINQLEKNNIDKNKGNIINKIKGIKNINFLLSF